MIRIITIIEPKIYSIKIPDRPVDGQWTDGWAVEIIGEATIEEYKKLDIGYGSV